MITSVMSDYGRLKELSEAECLALLCTVPLGRVGISSDALPAVLPVNFVLQDKSILFRTVPGTKLHAAVAGVVVAFEADHYDQATGEAWSVLVRGVAEEIVDPERRAQAGPIVPGSWACRLGAHHLIQVPITLISGRRLSHI
jgi:nitroimidazol reductase NimA-like FMN-containing flavoprotein (pyridoxamine 5'-phosphate oxidase superfamily)